MSASDEPRRVHFQSPEYLVERLDAIADLFDTDRTDLLVEAIRDYIEDTAESETFRELVATKYYDGQLEFETVKQLVGAETAQRLRLLKADLESEPLDLAAPDDVDVYGGDAETVEVDDAVEDADAASDPADADGTVDLDDGTVDLDDETDDTGE